VKTFFLLSTTLLLFNLSFAYDYVYEKYSNIEEAIKDASLNKDGLLYGKIGVEYLYGEKIVKKDYKKALYFFNKSYELGVISASYYIGSIYLYGLDVTKDYKKGLNYIKISADSGYTKAQSLYGETFLSGLFEQKPDPEKGLPYLKKAALAGSSDAAMALTEFYNSDEKYKNIVESYKWAKFAEKYHDTRVLPHLINYSLKFKIDNNAVKKVFLYATLIIWNNKDDKEYIDKVIEIKNKALENYIGNRYKLIEEAVKMADEWGIKR